MGHRLPRSPAPAVNVNSPQAIALIRAAPPGDDGRHGRAHPEAPRLVAGRGHEAVFARSANGQRDTAQAGIVALLHGRVEGVHVHMDDTAEGRGLVSRRRHGGRRTGGGRNGACGAWHWTLANHAQPASPADGDGWRQGPASAVAGRCRRRRRGSHAVRHWLAPTFAGLYWACDSGGWQPQACQSWMRGHDQPILLMTR